MSQILFIVDVPPLAKGEQYSEPSNVSASWRSFETAVADKKLGISSKVRGARSAWLLAAANSLDTLLALSNLARDNNLTYRAFFLPEDAVELNKPPSSSEAASFPHMVR